MKGTSYITYLKFSRGKIKYMNSLFQTWILYFLDIKLCLLWIYHSLMKSFLWHAGLEYWHLCPLRMVDPCKIWATKTFVTHHLKQGVPRIYHSHKIQKETFCRGRWVIRPWVWKRRLITSKHQRTCFSLCNVPGSSFWHSKQQIQKCYLRPCRTIAHEGKHCQLSTRLHMFTLLKFPGRATFWLKSSGRHLGMDIKFLLSLGLGSINPCSSMGALPGPEGPKPVWASPQLSLCYLLPVAFYSRY